MTFIVIQKFIFVIHFILTRYYLDDNLNNMSEQQSIFTALSDVHRRNIINLLKQGEMSVAELAVHFEFSGATLSHHLSVLKSAELVRVRKDKQKRIYTLNMSVVEEILLLMKQLFY